MRKPDSTHPPEHRNTQSRPQFYQLTHCGEWRLKSRHMKTSLFDNCFHGGAFFSAIGENFDTLERNRSIIAADVLDAWFAPAPAVIEALTDHLPWLLRTSPPTHCAGLIETIAEARGVAPENILPGAGSSDLIFRAMREWLTPASRVLILDPTYGEYAHVLEKVIGCPVARFPLRRDEGYEVSLRRLHVVLRGEWDLVVLVNPNSPTGRHIPRGAMEEMLREIPATTRVWVDETYVDYAGADESLERFAAGTKNIYVCKSMSKVYALSGARVAYLCGPRSELEPLRAITPPWVVGLPSQVAAVRALQSPGYYAARYAETHRLRETLAEDLTALGWDMVPGIANFLLCHLPSRGPAAAEIVSAARERGLYVRDAGAMGAQLGAHALRLAVKDEVTNRRMVEILREVSVCERVACAAG
jgi:histidinol-phosphate/aromatic aminotransferase/cobyric acid decarboxylase-like protein